MLIIRVHPHCSQYPSPVIIKVEDGIIVHVKRKMPNGVCLVRLQAITDRIIRVTASPVDSFINTPSLITSCQRKERP